MTDRLEPGPVQADLAPALRSLAQVDPQTAPHRGQRGRKMTDLHIPLRDPRPDPQVKAVPLQAGATATDRQAAAPSAASLLQDVITGQSQEVADPMGTNQRGRSLNQVVVPLTSAQARQGRNQPDPRQSRWKSWGPASRRACTLSRFRISDARKNQGQIGQELTGPELTVPAQAVLHPDTQDQRAQDRADPVRAVPGRFARAVAVRVPHVPSEAKAD